jgi:hypothetical protein
MRLRPLSVLLACALLFCSAAAFACGGGGGGTTAAGHTPSGTAGPVLTLLEYFQKVQALNAQSVQRLDALSTLLVPSPSADQALQLARDAIAQEGAILKDLRDALQQLSPPPEVRAAHNEVINALSAFLGYSQKANDAAATATNLVDVAKFLGSKETRALDARLTDSCLALQKAAADHGITIDLGCTSAAPE